MSNTCFDVNVIEKEDVVLAKATTTFVYTTVPCTPTVISHPIAVNVCQAECGIKASAPIGLPAVKIVGCGASFKQFKIVSVPAEGELFIGTVKVLINTFWSKQDFAGLYYVLTNELATTDTFNFRAETATANSPNYAVTITVEDCTVCDDCNCADVTTTTVTTTTP